MALRATSKSLAQGRISGMAFVALTVLSVAIQFAALGREATALTQLNYQVARWATDPANNNIGGTNSPQCSDIVNLLKGSSVLPYSGAPNLTTGYMGKLASKGVACGSPPAG